MAESRYGRLFTEADVGMLLRCMGMASDTDSDVDIAAWIRSGLEVADAVRPLTFPADEPLFLLRGQDKAAPATILHYSVLCMSHWIGASGEHIVAAKAAMDAVEAWQAEHPDRVKVPD